MAREPDPIPSFSQTLRFGKGDGAAARIARYEMALRAIIIVEATCANSPAKKIAMEALIGSSVTLTDQGH